MALRKTVTTIHGLVAMDAYHRVECLSVKSKAEIEFRVRSYAETSGLPAFSDMLVTCPYDLQGENPIKQAYDYIKVQSEFEGAEDC